MREPNCPLGECFLKQINLFGKILSKKHPSRGQFGSRKFDLPVEALGPKNGQKHFPLHLGGFPAY